MADRSSLSASVVGCSTHSASTGTGEPISILRSVGSARCGWSLCRVHVAYSSLSGLMVFVLAMVAGALYALKLAKGQLLVKVTFGM